MKPHQCAVLGAACRDGGAAAGFGRRGLDRQKRRRQSLSGQRAPDDAQFPIRHKRI